MKTRGHGDTGTRGHGDQRPILRVLSLWQPWATLMAIDAKRIETRSWSTGYRGMVAIHASKKWSREMLAVCLRRPFIDALGALKCRALPLGMVVAIGELYEIETTPSAKAFLLETSEAREMAFGDYSEGRFAWHFRRVIRLPSPIRFSATQGLFSAPAELRERIALAQPELAMDGQAPEEVSLFMRLILCPTESRRSFGCTTRPFAG